jgi:hypothetical protein
MTFVRCPQRPPLVARSRARSMGSARAASRPPPVGSGNHMARFLHAVDGRDIDDSRRQRTRPRAGSSQPPWVPPELRGQGFDCDISPQLAVARGRPPIPPAPNRATISWSDSPAEHFSPPAVCVMSCSGSRARSSSIENSILLVSQYHGIVGDGRYPVCARHMPSPSLSAFCGQFLPVG